MDTIITIIALTCIIAAALRLTDISSYHARLEAYLLWIVGICLLILLRVSE